MKELLLYHWHCILPIIGIVAAVFYIRRKDSEGGRKNGEQEKDGQEVKK